MSRLARSKKSKKAAVLCTLHTRDEPGDLPLDELVFAHVVTIDVSIERPTEQQTPGRSSMHKVAGCTSCSRDNAGTSLCRCQGRCIRDRGRETRCAHKRLDGVGTRECDREDTDVAETRDQVARSTHGSVWQSSVGRLESDVADLLSAPVAVPLEFDGGVLNARVVDAREARTFWRKQGL